MSLSAILEELDRDIGDLQGKIDPKRPEADLRSFARLRVLSLGRTVLRLIEDPKAASWREIDDAYDRARGRIIS